MSERLLPLDCYPENLDDTGRDRVDDQLRSQLHTVPTLPGRYRDNQGDLWILDVDGGWTDRHGDHRGPEHAPLIAAFGPMRPVAPSTWFKLLVIAEAGCMLAAFWLTRPVDRISPRLTRGADRWMGRVAERIDLAIASDHPATPRKERHGQG